MNYQKIIKDGWVEQEMEKGFLSEKALRRAQKSVQEAMSFLDKIEPGTEVVFEGSCPAGSTYVDYHTWDGTIDSREEIAESAYVYPRHRLVTVDSANITVAQMRTGS
jgi:hypothetical protein